MPAQLSTLSTSFSGPKDKNKTIMKTSAGETFPLTSDKDILSINSPKNSLKGPWFVVHCDVTNRWAIVIMHWNDEPRLGIRWFYGTSGTPSVRGYATWLVIPDSLSEAILSKLPISPSLRKRIDAILRNEYSISELQYERKRMGLSK